MYTDEQKKTMVELMDLMSDKELFRDRAKMKCDIATDRGHLESDQWALDALNAEIDKRAVAKCEEEKP